MNCVLSQGWDKTVEGDRIVFCSVLSAGIVWIVPVINEIRSIQVIIAR